LTVNYSGVKFYYSCSGTLVLIKLKIALVSSSFALNTDSIFHPSIPLLKAHLSTHHYLRFFI